MIMAAYEEPLFGDPTHKRNKSIPSFESYMIRKAPGLEGREKSWADVEKERIHRSSDDLAGDLRKRGRSGTDALLALMKVQQRHVSSLVEDKQHREKQPGAEWSWVRIDLEFVGKVPRGARRTSKDARTICVILQRIVTISESGPSGAENLDERFRKMNLHQDDEHIAQVRDSREDHRGFAFSRQSPDGDHQRPGTYQDQLHMSQPNATGSVPVLQMGDPPVPQRWPQGYLHPRKASEYPGFQKGYPPPPLGPPGLDSRYLPHLRGDGAVHSRDGSQYAGSAHDSQYAGLPDPQAEPPDIEGWPNESTDRPYIPDRQDRDRKDVDDSSCTQRGNKYYKHERSCYPAHQGSSKYHKHKESVVQPATTRHRSPQDDNRHREPRPRRKDRRPSPQVSQRDRQASYSPSPPPKHRRRRDRPRSPSPSDSRRGRDRTSRKNRSYIPDDDDGHSSEHSSRTSSPSPSPVLKPRRTRDRSTERRDDYSPNRPSRKERRDNKRRADSPKNYRH